VAIGALTLLAHVLGAGPLRGLLWGSHFYGFLPPAAMVVAALATLGVVALVRYGSWLAQGPMGDLSPAPGWPSFRRALAGLGILVALALFWVFRAGHLLWGDGRPLTRHVSAGDRFHPLEPLTQLAQSVVHTVLQPLFRSVGGDDLEVARNAVALGSAISGALFIVVAWLLARAFFASRPGGGPRPASPAARDADDGIVPLAFLVLVAQGYIQLFFGYVENYTFYALSLAVYLLTAHAFLARRTPLLVPATALIMALAFHLSAATMLPSFAVLAAVALARPDGRMAALRDLALGGLLFALASQLGPDYRFGPTLFGLLAGLGREAGQSAYLVSSQHTRDFLNEQLLVGPFGLFLFLPLALAALAGPARRDAAVWFSIAAAGGYLAACWTAGDSNLGYSRNWDLLAPAGFVFTAAGLHLLSRARWNPAGLRRWLAVAAALSLIHTVPWVAMNSSFAYSFERLKTLPLGLGRTEAIVGTWYFDLGRDEEAVRWFSRSLEAYPANNIAAYYLGEIAMGRQDYPSAAAGYAHALRARPDKQLYRARLAEALLRGDRPASAKSQLDTLIAVNPREPGYWVGTALAWSALGRPDSATRAFQTAHALAPRDSISMTLERRLDETGDTEVVIREYWSGLSGP
jgi:tetratricopeptide (TPR) repeat protein